MEGLVINGIIALLKDPRYQMPANLRLKIPESMNSFVTDYKVE